MPKPSPSTYPKELRWRFVQRLISDTELVDFAKSICELDGKKIDDVLPRLLSFLKLGKTGLKDSWLDIWVNIMHQMGLGYTSQAGKLIHATDLAEFIALTKDIKAFYYYWSLKFQYPFGYPKQLHYIKNGISVQPVVLILQHLIELYNQTNDYAKTYLTKDEITFFLMRSKNHQNIQVACRQILANRQSNFDYSLEEQRKPGFAEAGVHFFARGKLFLNNVDLLTFRTDKIILNDEDHKRRIEAFLSYWKPPLQFTMNSQDMRNRYFEISFDSLDPDPRQLAFSINAINDKVSQILFKKEPKLKTTEILQQRLIRQTVITNPSLVRGTFSRRQVSSRNFQASLRRDLLVLYNSKCAICGLTMAEFLRASHIIPVGTDPDIAADRSNAILLCVLHDVAFEQGYLGFDDAYKIIVHSALKTGSTHPIVQKEIIDREGATLILPNQLKPNVEYIKRHRLLNNLH